MKIAQILIPNVGILDYLIGDTEPKIGSVAIVPFKSKRSVGIVVEIINKSTVEPEKLKNIESITPINIGLNNLAFINWISKYYLANLGFVIKLLIPNYISSSILKKTKFELLSENSCKTIYTPPNFSIEQVEALKQIDNIFTQGFKSILIDGVTGSGKTEVFLASAAKILTKEQDAQVLIMLPEISLTPQIANRISSRFNHHPILWHSSISDKYKKSAFYDILNGSAKIIVGARSALFLPFKNLKLIIVDEEHEQLYKQEDGVTYQARDMAIMRAKLENIPILLASASPSIESIQNSSLGKHQKINLLKRYNDKTLPEVKVIDMKKNKAKNAGFISSSLVAALNDNLSQNKQSLLFLNRKGYSPMLICKDCGHKICCKNCSASLVYHKSSKKLKCHQCGYVSAIPKNCYNCESSSENFVTCGPGVEKILEEVNKLFPLAKVITLTQDNFNNFEKTKEILSAITNNEYNIIIGTQIIAKGHHFPHLSLVGIIDADTGIISGDLRATEKNFQLLQQVGGRAGREIENSKVYIQTFNPEHPMILALASYDRDKFFAEEIESRKMAEMPPFGRLASIILSSKFEESLDKFAKLLIQAAPVSKDIKLFGPAPAQIYKLRGKFRQRILIKTSKKINIQKYISDWLENIKTPSSVHLKIDIDPYYFL